MQKIIIVESPSKSKAIESYMGADYKVLSSKGHVRDLAIRGVGGLGIDIENNFTPMYKNLKDKEKLIRDLTKQCKGKQVYLATDPDREGEAISWHLAQILELDMDQDNRVVFNEITKDAVKDAFSQPRKIDQHLVSSQETRRIVDRIIGFKLSKLLQSKIKSKSAGRVQSATLKLIVDLEREVTAFTPEQYFEIHAHFNDFTAQLFAKGKEKLSTIHGEEHANLIKETLDTTFKVNEIEVKTTKRASKPPYLTSTLQQDASNKLNFNGSKTMRVAQALYEGKDIKDETVGLITYMRTDSNRLSASFIGQAKDHIKKTYGNQYIGSAKQSKNVNAQDAHEAIRPTSIARKPEMMKSFLSRDEFKVYELIYNRALASLMAPALYETTRIDLINQGYTFRANGSKLDFPGYLKVYEDQEREDNTLPALKKEETLNAKAIELTEHYTKPPARFTEAKLIKAMEESGIGRPSTYSQTLKTLKDRSYVTINEKKYEPTPQGMLTIEKLEEFFSRIISVDYTAKMENVLDNIANGEAEYEIVVSDFYERFIPLVEKATEQMVKLEPEKTDEFCPECGSSLVKRQGRYGEFIACGAYPECKYIRKENGEDEKTGLKCPECKKGNIVKKIARRGRNKGNPFYACDNFPKCKYTLSELPKE